jgi:hypothetical protein
MRIVEVMESLQNENYQIVYRDAKTRRICIICKRPAETFRDQSAKLEYSISAICQRCQDNLFERCD